MDISTFIHALNGFKGTVMTFIALQKFRLQMWFLSIHHRILKKISSVPKKNY